MGVAKLDIRVVNIVVEVHCACAVAGDIDCVAVGAVDIVVHVDWTIVVRNKMEFGLWVHPDCLIVFFALALLDVVAAESRRTRVRDDIKISGRVDRTATGSLFFWVDVVVVEVRINYATIFGANIASIIYCSTLG